MIRCFRLEPMFDIEQKGVPLSVRKETSQSFTLENESHGYKKQQRSFFSELGQGAD